MDEKMLDTVKENIVKTFKSINIDKYYSFDDSDVRGNSIVVSKYEHLCINNLLMPYKLGDMVEIVIKSGDGAATEDKDSTGCVGIVFDDGCHMYFYSDRIEAEIQGRRYHDTQAVLYRLNYIYRTQIIGKRVNPLIIIDKSLLAYCGNEKRVSVPNGVVKIDDYAFENAPVKIVSLPSSLQRLGESVFSGCEKLTDILFGGQDEFIGYEVFEESNIEKAIKVPGNIIYDSKRTFAGTNLQIQ